MKVIKLNPLEISISYGLTHIQELLPVGYQFRLELTDWFLYLIFLLLKTFFKEKFWFVERTGYLLEFRSKVSLFWLQLVLLRGRFVGGRKGRVGQEALVWWLVRVLHWVSFSDIISKKLIKVGLLASLLHLIFNIRCLLIDVVLLNFKNSR